MINIILVNLVLTLFGTTLIITGINNSKSLFPILTGILFLYLSILSITQNISKNLNDNKLKRILSSRLLNTIHFVNLIMIILTIIYFSIKDF